MSPVDSATPAGRVAAIYDIHGNLPALEAVLREIQRERVEQIVVGGDVVPGPMPREVMALLVDLEIPVRFIRGDGERAVLARLGGVETDSVPEQFREIIRWSGEELTHEQARLQADWPETLPLAVAGLGDVLFCHGTPRRDNEIFTRLTPDASLRPVFEHVRAHVVVCGHTHMQFDRWVGDARVVNAGSIGMPFGEPGAYWLLLGPDIELRHTEYDLAAAEARVRATEYPHADEFAAQNVLEPPPESEMLELFERAALQ